MRSPLLAALLAAVVLAASPYAAAARADRTSGCPRMERALKTFERRASHRRRCGNPEGCTRRERRRHARLTGMLADRCVKLNQIQVLGTHNSYHVQPRPELFSALLALSPVFSAWEYTHRPLAEQFDDLGIRQIELDVFADPNGGLYATRRGLIEIGQDPASHLPALDRPGFKVLHIQDLDFETTCLTFVDCLATVKGWSDAHPRHLPLMILVEAKDDPLPDLFQLGFLPPLPIGGPELDAVDAEIRSVFPPAQLITPDDVRGDAATLEEAVLTTGWPTLEVARGRILFTLDNGGDKRAAYVTGHPSLAGRVLFTDSSPGEPEAAFVKENDPLPDPTHISELVAAGYVVRTRADADTQQARAGDTTQRDAALTSGAQWVSTDYPEENPAFGTGYVVRIPAGAPARCNPVNAPPGCRAAALESP